MNDIILRTYEGRDRAAFRALNEAWIRKHFCMEAKDYEVLSDPETHILARGGHIILAERDGQVVGCCALLRIERGFELGKMAVTENLQGKGVGRKILLHAVETARNAGARRIYLESNHALRNAIHLYEAVGFVHIPPEEITPSPYSRSNVHMELLLAETKREN